MRAKVLFFSSLTFAYLQIFSVFRCWNKKDFYLCSESIIYQSWIFCNMIALNLMISSGRNFSDIQLFCLLAIQAISQKPLCQKTGSPSFKRRKLALCLEKMDWRYKNRNFFSKKNLSWISFKNVLPNILTTQLNDHAFIALPDGVAKWVLLLCRRTQNTPGRYSSCCLKVDSI